MNDWLLLVALLVAIAIGWSLGRRDIRQKDSKGADSPDGYFEGLSFLVKEQPDETIDLFINALGAQGSAVDTHLALGRLFRTRGELDKATRVHQALLARTDLSRDDQLLAQFELANDYMGAGLFDRAERLLRELSGSGGEIKWRSTQLLMEIYQHEKEWDQAIAAALVLLPKQGKEIRPVLAHYCCEKATDFIAADETTMARRELKRALNYDPKCVRASLLKGQLETQARHYKEAIKAYRRVKDQDPSYLPESIPNLSVCYREMGKEKELKEFLLDCLQQNPSITVVLAITDLLYSGPEDREAAHLFISEQLKNRPSLKGVLRLIDLHMGNTRNDEKSYLVELRNLAAQLIESKPVYRCSQCGYGGKRLSWLCPSCKSWGKIKPIYGLEGE